MNKYLLSLTLLFLGTPAVANEKPSAEFVQESLDYCMEKFDKTTVPLSEVLNCLNEEMELEGYEPFPSMKAVRSYVKSRKTLAKS